MIRALPYGHTASRPDPARVLAIAAAVAVHVLAFLLLLLPLTAPPFSITAADSPPPRPWWVRVEPAVTPRPPQVVAVVKPERPQPRPTPPVALPQPVTHLSLAPTAEHGLLAAEPALDSAPSVADIAPASGTPLLGAHLQYERAAPPPYPRTALAARAEGTVILLILVDTDGQPLEVTIDRGSGHRELDDAARRHVLRHWRFKPAVRDGNAVQAYGRVPIDFRLQ